MITNSFFIVLGMHRSGTSALTGVLNALGFIVGEHLLPPALDNERGFFEDAKIVHQHDVLLDLLGRSWSDVRCLPQNWLNNPVLNEQKKLLTSLLESEFDLQRPCVMKDPRLCHLLPLWQIILAEFNIKPRYVISLRHPFEVAASLRKRNNFETNRSALLYTRYLLQAEKMTREHAGLRVVIKYDSLVQDWRQAVQCIESTLNLSLLSVDDNIQKNIDDFLSPELKHFDIKALDYDVLSHYNAAPMRMAQQVYQLLGGTLNELAYQSLDEIHIELNKFIAGLEPWLSSANEIEQFKPSISNQGIENSNIFPTHDSIPVLAQELEKIVLTMRATLLKRDETIAQKEIKLQELEEKQELLRKQLIRAEAQLSLLKDIMIGHLESNDNQIGF